MHPDVERLTALVPPPANASPRDWTTVEAALGTLLPADYRQLVDTYGGGVFDETVWLLDPSCPDDDYNLVAQAAERADTLEKLWQTEPKPQQLQAPGARVLPWAYIEDTGAMLYWLIRPDDQPDGWTVMFNEGRGPLWEHHDTTCAGFLLAVLTGEADTDYFPDLPADDHTFDSNDDILE
ncbi:SMI1/KNR4 family protein [uncultured Streptomyces sp.]|uniref:SMI1/KNR4 family protein n=1 Tax=uncultured Streptomyces sp. TaxID=174707 RepID=UPI002624D395|nr:SMI1/KNR4 family protein [uncultured Streptomyces sp.]